MSALSPAVVAAIDDLELAARIVVEGMRTGGHRSPFHGYTTEFRQHRPYRAGDDLKYLDWKLYARSDRLYIKVFREEVDLFAYVFIDASASMAFPSREEKFLPASHVALSLAYVILANHDHVKLHLLQHGAGNASPFYRGRRRMTDCVDFIQSARPAGALGLAASVGEHLKRLRRPGKAILISDFLMPAAAYQQGLNLLRVQSRHRRHSSAVAL